MILLIILVVSSVLLPVANIFCIGKKRMILTAIAGLLFSISILLVVENQKNHLGMKEVTIKKEVDIVSSVEHESMNILLYKPLGNGQEKVYLYRTNKNEEKPKPTGQSKIVNKVIVNNNQKAILGTDKIEWQYKNDFYKKLFSLEKETSILIKEDNTFSIPKNWLTLSTEEAEKLSKELEMNEDKIKKEGQIWVGEEMKQQIIANPEMTEKEKQDSIKLLTEVYQQKTIEKLLNK